MPQISNAIRMDKEYISTFIIEKLQNENFSAELQGNFIIIKDFGKIELIIGSSKRYSMECLSCTHGDLFDLFGEKYGFNLYQGKDRAEFDNDLEDMINHMKELTRKS